MGACPDIAKGEIADLRAKGLEPSLDQIATLINLARKIAEPDYRTAEYLSHVGMRAGDSQHVLRPLTIRSGIWYSWIVDQLTEDTMCMYACAFAMEHGANPDVDFKPLFDFGKAVDAITNYATSCTATVAELKSAIARCGSDPDEWYGRDARAKLDGDQSGDGYEDTIARLVAATGLPDTYWEQRTMTFANKVLLHSLEQGAGIFGGVETDSEYRRANFNFFAALEAIERELTEGAG